MRVQLLLILALIGSGSPVAAGDPVSVALVRDGYPVFISESEIAAAMASNERFSFEESFPSLPRHKRNVMKALDGQLNNLSPVGGSGCSPFKEQPQSVDEEQPRSVDRRVRYFPASFIGTVEHLTPGWASGFATTSQLATMVVHVSISSGPYTLQGNERVHVVVPYGSLTLSGGTLCTERGIWPAIEVGSRLLVNGYWEKLAPDAVVWPVDIAAIENGRFLPNSLPDLDLSAVASEGELLERLGGSAGAKP